MLGQNYIPLDNSGETCLTGDSIGFLAGTDCQKPRLCKIVSGVYTKRVSFLGRMYERKFINVWYKGHVYGTMYFEQCVNDDMNERLKRHHEQYKDI